MAEPTETAIDDVIASCDGDLRGALRALLILNEQLESELQHMYAQAAHGSAHPGNSALH